MHEEMKVENFEKILVVDDTTANLQLLTHLLTAHGYTVYPASDGELALEFVQSNYPDLILLDIRLPGLDGYEVCRRLKADGRTRSIPVIFISILEDERDKVKGFRAGAVDYITKPFQAEEVLARLRIHLQHKELIENLEQKVTERTEKLNVVNEQLQRELDDRKRSGEALTESEKRYRQLLASVTDYFYTVHVRDGRPISTVHGPGCTAVTGYTCEDYAADPDLWYRMVHEQDRAAVMELSSGIFTGKSVPSLEHRIIHRDGSTRWVKHTPVPRHDEDGCLIAYDGLIQDITGRKLAEEALRESEKKVRRKLNAVLSPEADIGELELSDIIDSDNIQSLMDEFYRLTNVGIGIIDLNGKVLVGAGWQDICTKYHRVNRESCRLCKESDLELSCNVPPGKFKQYKCKNNMWDIATPIMLGDRHIGNIFLGQFLYDDEEVDYEIFRGQARRYGFDEKEYIDALDRVPRWSRQKVDAAVSFYAGFAGMMGNLSYSNIKLAKALEDERRTEIILNRERSLLSRITETSPIGIVMTNPDGTITYTNSHAEKIFGLTKDEIAQRRYNAPEWRITDLDGGTFPEENLPLRKVMSGGKPVYDIRHVIEWPDGRRVYLSINGAPLLDETGKIESIIFSIEDITESKRAELELQRANDLLRAIIEAAPVAIIGLDLEGKVHTVWNPAAEKMLGWSAKEALGNFLPSVPLDKENEYRRFREWIKSGISLDGIEVQRKKRSGELIDYSIYAAPLYDVNGSITGNIAVLVDITDRKRKDEILRNTFRLLKETQRLAHIGSWELDLLQNDLSWSDEIFRIFEVDPEKFSATYEAFLDAVHPEDRKAVDFAYTNSLKTKTPYSIDHRLLFPGGRIKYVHEHCETFYEEDKPIRSIGTVQDITERKKIEDDLLKIRNHLEELVIERTAELESARNKARQYLDIAGVMLVAIGADRRVSLINQKGCEVLGSAQCDIIGKDWFETFVPVNVRKDVIRGFQQLMAGELKLVEYFENTVLTRAGGERLIAWHNVILRDGNGVIAGTLSSGEDITEQKRAEKQITDLNRDLRERAVALEAANRELEAFAYSVSHDLRAPLRHIDGFLDLLKKKTGTTLDEKGRHYMASISDSARKMGELIDDLLSFSRMGRQAITLKQVDLGIIVREVIRELEPDAAGRNIDWHIEDLPTVNGDASMLRIVMINLISNALKFTRPREQAKIEIGVLPGPGSENVIFVRDNGVGYNPAYAGKLFGVFQRLHRADEFEGTGVGLAIAQRIIFRHGGRIWAEGELDHGAVFYFSLPL